MRVIASIAFALVLLASAFASARALVTFEASREPERAKTRVTLRTDDVAVRTIAYTINKSAMALSATASNDVEMYDVASAKAIELSVGTWTIQAAEVRGKELGETYEARYDVRPRETTKSARAMEAVGVMALLVMISIGVVIVGGVCAAGFNAFLKAAPVMRGPGADGFERRGTTRSPSASALELGLAGSGAGYRNNPTAVKDGDGGDDDSGTARLLANAAQELAGAASRAGKRD